MGIIGTWKFQAIGVEAVAIFTFTTPPRGATANSGFAVKATIATAPTGFIPARPAVDKA